LHESGSIEQDEEMVLMLSRHKEGDEDQEALIDLVPRDLIIAKQQNGAVGSVTLNF
jgi:replicative DNA helicase